MKIAILTQPLCKNYGGIMQAYALQKILREEGHNVITIDRRSKRKFRFRELLGFCKYTLLKTLGKDQPIRLTAALRRKVYSENVKFIEQEIALSEMLVTSRQLASYFAENKFEAIVVGSDQTWRPKYSPNIFNYYLDFAVDCNVKRIAYASSFGVDQWEYSCDETTKCRELIKHFDFVSVREKSGVTLCENYLGAKASCVLDPTMLLSDTDYRKLWSDHKLDDEDKVGSVFAYILDKSEYKSQVMEAAAKYLGQSIEMCEPKRSLSQAYRGDIGEFIYPSPSNWVKKFAQSSFVVTDSFHGCVFSIIFNKPFIAIGNPVRGLARFLSLLENFGLGERLIKEDDAGYEEILKSEIDWIAVNRKLEKERIRSKNLLFKAIAADRLHNLLIKKNSVEGS